VRSLASAIALAAIVTGCTASDDGASALRDDTAAAPKLRFTEYDVRFTNPTCQTYAYGPDQQVVSRSGAPLAAKPKDVFCTQRDNAASASRPEAPQTKLLSWIDDPATTEIFFAYLSFSNRVVEEAICRAVTERGVKVTFVLDSQTDLGTANALQQCTSPSGDRPKLVLRGHTSGIGFAHNKVFMVNPGAESMRIAFSSGNMTSGIVLHHENWHFITLPRDTNFAQAHMCLMNGVIDHADTGAAYRTFIRNCRAAIPFPAESDIKAFFVPGEGDKATDQLVGAVGDAEQIRLAAHRFSFNKLIAALKGRLQGQNPPSLQMVFDDDVWWAGHGEVTGDNNAAEFNNANSLVRLGGDARWMETNHSQHLLHHNKYWVLNMPQGARPSAVFGGAGNLTGTAFSSNLENFYYVEIPEVVAAYNRQYDHVLADLATKTDDLPSQNILPSSNGVPTPPAGGDGDDD
jgi:hypothetical protein